MIVAGNWKLNTTLNEGLQLVSKIEDFISKLGPMEVRIIAAAPYTHLERMVNATHRIEVFAQDVSRHESGAFTGEVSALMLKSIGVKGAIVGHSERRTYHGESDEIIHEKILRCMQHNLDVIYCCGEQLQDRQNGHTMEVIEQQISKALLNLKAEQFKSLVIAYEPVWAIGTGETATPEQAQEVHQFIRNWLKQNKGEEVSEKTQILYGGSVKADNADELFQKPDIDGGLIGGASLKAEDFVQIVKAAG